MAYFNHTNVASDVFSRNIGKALWRLKRKREASDYDDFYVASYEETIEQLGYAKEIVEQIKNYVSNL